MHVSLSVALPWLLEMVDGPLLQPCAQEAASLDLIVDNLSLSGIHTQVHGNAELVLPGGVF